jgi:hypothetical protein
VKNKTSVKSNDGFIPAAGVSFLICLVLIVVVSFIGFFFVGPMVIGKFADRNKKKSEAR